MEAISQRLVTEATVTYEHSSHWKFARPKWRQGDF